MTAADTGTSTDDADARFAGIGAALTEAVVAAVPAWV